MPKKKRPRDVNQLAKLLMEQATGEAPAEPKAEESGKNPAAVALGRLGGRKGGKARPNYRATCHACSLEREGRRKEYPLAG